MTSPSAPESPSLDPYVAGPPAPVPERSRRIRPVHWLGAVLVVVLLGGAVVAVVQTGNEEPATPEEAVRSLLEAAAAGDLAGSLDQLVEQEDAVLRQPLLELAAEFRRLDITMKHRPLDLERARYRVENLAAHVQLVHVEGVDVDTLSSRGDPVLGAFLRTFTGMPFEFEDEPAELAVVVVDDDGGWRPSVWYSMLDTVRRRAERPTPSFASPSPRGAPSPEEAARAYVEATTSTDARRAVELSDPVQLRALHDYAAVLIPEAAPADDLSFDLGVDVRELELAADIDGDQADVRIERSVVTFDDTTITYDGRCLHVDPPDEELLPKALECTSAAALMSTGPTFPGFGPSLRTVRRGDSWFVQPMAGALQGLADALGTDLPEEDVDDMRDSAIDSVSFFLQVPFLLGYPSLTMAGGADLEELSGEDMAGGAFACMAEVGPTLGADSPQAMAAAVTACAEKKLAAGEIQQAEFDQFKAFVACMVQTTTSPEGDEIEIPACVDDLSTLGPIGTDEVIEEPAPDRTP